MSYASKAAESGPTGSEKLPTPPQVKQTSDPSGSVETVAEDAKKSALGGKAVVEEKVEDLKKDLPKLGEEAKKAEREAEKRVKKAYEDNKGPVLNFIRNVSEKVTQGVDYVFGKASSGAATAQEELKNPVVATQTVVSIGAISAAIVAIQDRQRIFRFKSDNEISLLLAAVAGFAILDGYLFSVFYPKYKKN
ncbi:putative membrane protein [Wickerhamomyces ciferrii]|uniref:Membrane protein n=1 Tax=Wickerhamomyces ciferrii (strain ATCC 14091 / BCRC 22168 / CBS 111 / JCM 3599 / NBRC 0793 / NRRL Y-1031 F-60-10) TaxID=1206466 RepID=K0KUU4_WICCF|nr:uncharacterized protein BN7_6598 [Wickerhamomyces ciferrii]CCH46991.1 putative membrane protein [Wickerhamomyces ciferrii]